MHSTTKATQKFIWIYATDIETKNQLKIVTKVLNTEPSIIRWSVDTEDIDNVLKVETSSLEELYIQRALEEQGLMCSPMTD